MKMIKPGLPLGLYIHIPFCERKCAYCDFLSFAAPEKIDAYIDKLLEELAFLSRRTCDYRIKTIYIGGGTPSLLTPDQVRKLLSGIHRNFNLKNVEEWTIEANPATFDEAKARMWKEYGINRVSMGVQSTSNALLRRIGRIHTAEKGREAFFTLREAGFTNVSVDLMMGLPEQSLDDYRASLKEILAWDPEHISCYSLILEEGTPLYLQAEEGHLSLPEEETERDMYHDTVTMLAEAGYQQYEISNFAKPGYESKHNASYWIRTPYIGAGLGAASLFEEKRYHNCTDLQQYLTSQPAELRELDETLTEEDQMLETMMLGLRRINGVSRKTFYQTFTKTIDSVFQKKIERLVSSGLLQDDGERIYLTHKGVDLANQVFMEFV